MLFLFALLCHTNVHAQKKTKLPSGSVGFNMDKIELLYKNVEVTRTSSNGASRSYTTKLPLLRFNGGETEPYKSDRLLPFLKDCPSAKKEVKLFDHERKRAVQFFFGGFLAGGALAFTGLIATAVRSEKGKSGEGIPFAVGFGLGIGTMTYGAIKAHKAKIRADKHLRQSVEQYNIKCYKGTPPPKDSIPKVAGNTMPTAHPTSAKDNSEEAVNGVTENFKERVTYEMQRNDPKSLAFWTAGIHYLDVEIAQNHGFNYAIGGDFIYQKGAKWGIRASAKIALVDNLSQETNRNDVAELNYLEQAEATDYVPANEQQVVLSIGIGGKSRESEHSVYLGFKDGVHHRGTLQANEYVSWNVRIGALRNQNVLFRNDGLPIRSSTPSTTVVVPGYWDPTPIPVNYYLENATVMTQSVSLSAGISRKLFNDLKINVLDSSFKGKKKDSSYTEFFADFLYAVSTQTGDVRYRFTEVNTQYEEFFLVNTSRTDIAKWGWRAGFTTAFVRGTGFSVECGQRPGPNAGRGYFSMTGWWRFGKELGGAKRD
jgi:hypothetical protein